ncbi:MAG: hypothetical protein CMK07_00165 [Ponticaulis sp.]|nr:hypothetical protein [Ponticaulis sp.]
MKKTRALSQREERMWQRVARTVRKIEGRHPDPEDAKPSTESLEPSKQQPDVIPPAIAPPSRPRASAADLEKLLNPDSTLHKKPSILQAETNKQVSSAGPANRGEERKIRRGKLETGPRLDLHGHTQDSARTALFQFVRFHQSQNEVSVLVITGKGRAGKGVIRQRFLDWLSEPEFKLIVSGYAQAHRKHGGDGAFYVFLRKPAQRKA